MSFFPISFAKSFPTDIPSLVLPSLRTSHLEEDIEYNDSQVEKFLSNNEGKAHRVMIASRLDGVKYYYGDRDEDVRDQKWVVFFPPSGLAYESLITDSKVMANALKANVLMFNYRGVSRSQDYPRNASHLVDDGVSSIRHLTDKGVKIQNILAYGQSIGAGVAAAVLAKERFQEGHIFFDRAPRDLPAVAEKFIPTSFLGSLGSSILRNRGWVFDNAENIQKIQGVKIVANTAADGMVDSSVALASTHGKEDEVIWLEPREDFNGDGRDFHTKCLFHKKTNPAFTNSHEAIQRAFNALHPSSGVLEDSDDDADYSFYSNIFGMDEMPQTNGLKDLPLTLNANKYSIAATHRSDASKRVIILPPVTDNGDDKQTPPPLDLDEDYD